MSFCSISKDYLDGVPHGFDTHVQKEHNLANYLFFLMYLINKDPSDCTGQETFVWDMYQERCWDFSPRATASESSTRASWEVTVARSGLFHDRSS